MGFGGGLGLFCEIVRELGKEITYVDIPGKVSDFARWRFYKNNIPVNFIIVNPKDRLKLSDEYDIIFSDAVIEHLTDPEQVVEELSLHLKEKWRVNYACGFK